MSCCGGRPGGRSQGGNHAAGRPPPPRVRVAAEPLHAVRRGARCWLLGSGVDTVGSMPSGASVSDRVVRKGIRSSGI